ncbi:polysaccharide biosynthesis tyrosine autokinase [Nostocaceae cyanobacterium CENA357]|uniref:Polysaccharide biosynthesis tyrosine autokinase n=1 Tax=Atlanticothrix silvestris CENA357 TaxID=1725252 RepID=A0A8J7KVD7_9CYAN|nr:polysaccharide biosynthesis tyrosine autokinase [Atlanticothrix silvestris]MBH8551105.1 polysaccharide biosynthesis tyrosine autokinase [Atlanticothrix silvestris CENA357]
MLKSEKYPHLLLNSNAAQFKESDEGGLNLGQVAAILRRRILLIIGITGLIATAAVLKAETDPPVYQGTFEILTKPVTGESKVIANVPQAINSQDGVSADADSKNSIFTTITVLQSPRVLDPIIEKLQPKYPDLTYKSLLLGLSIQSAAKSNQILAVQYTDEDQQQVIDVSTLLADAYLKYSLEERQSDVDQAISFVNQQRKPLDERVKYWQNQLRNLRWENSLIDPVQKSQELSEQIAAFRQQQITNRVELEQLVARYNDLQKELAQQPGERAGNSLLTENARYQNILTQIQETEIETRQRAAVLTDDNPLMETLRQRKAYLLPLLTEEEVRVQKDFQSRIQSLIARDTSLSDKIKNLNNEMRALATISRNHDNIQRELQIANNGLTQFTTKQQALQIEKAQKQQPWLLLDPKLATVTNPNPVSNSAKLNLALGGILGLLLGVGAALVVDKLSDIFYTAQELKDTTRLPLLGIVPLRKELEPASETNLSRELQQPNRASFFEVFRSLYTNILLLGSDTPIRSLVISSPGQGDGKSTIAVQLAQAASAMGQRVLLVDANLRSPSLHNRVGLMNVQGLTDIISQDLDWHNVIERSPLEENLFVMTAGPIPPDSVRLLASQKMQDLMNELQADFDLVIYDTPPLLGFADAYLLAANTNGMVLVAGLGKLKRTAMQQVLEEIQVSGTPLLGMIANKSKEGTPVSHQYYQQYYKQSVSAERVGEVVEVESNSSALRRIRRP